MFKKAKPLKDPTSEKHGFEYAIFLLSLRMRTEGEIREKMKERGYEQKVINHTIGRLFDLKYIDDKHFAEAYISSFKDYKTYGYQFIKQKMFLKKLDKVLIEEALEEFLPVEAELQVAKRFLEKNFPTYLTAKAKFDYKAKQKIAQKMKAKGFRMDVIAKWMF